MFGPRGESLCSQRIITDKEINHGVNMMKSKRELTDTICWLAIGATITENPGQNRNTQQSYFYKCWIETMVPSLTCYDTLVRYLEGFRCIYTQNGDFKVHAGIQNNIMDFSFSMYLSFTF